MKKILPVFCLLIITAKGFSQQLSQYNTGTLFDSFENPAQRSFIPDSSRTYAFNFFFPNIGGNFYLKGDAQSSLISRAFGAKYNNDALQIGSGNYNYANANATAYAVMAKMFVSTSGDEEVGFFIGAKGEGRGTFTDESLALFNGTSAFPNNTYDNLFNDNYSYQVYNAIGLSYREKLSDQFAIGIKVSLLEGLYYNKLDIDESHVNLDKANDAAVISLRGKYYLSQGPGKLDARSFLPTLRSPGAQISIGTAYKTEDNITIQGNIKDLGFIHWYDNSLVSNYNSTATATGISGNGHEQILYNTVHEIITSGAQTSSFTSATDGRFELSANKSFGLNADNSFIYSPTLIASKELFYNGFLGALVNHFQYSNYHASLSASYDNQNLFNLGLQLMYKTYNGEFFIGSDRLGQTFAFESATHNPSTYANGPFTGADIFIGFSIKFGPVIEHPLNASSTPTGDKGFIARLWNRMFKTYQ